MTTRPTTAQRLAARPRAGFSLIEIVVVMGALGVALVLLVAILCGALGLERASAGGVEGLRVRQLLADQFRADVAQAKEAPPRWQEDVAGPTCLILVQGQDRHVLYRWKAGRLVRSEYVGETTQHRELGLAGLPATVEFGRSGPGDRLLTLRLFGMRQNGSKGPPLEITAALGGDLQ